MLVAGIVEVAALVEELDSFGERQKAMRKSRRDKNLIVVVGREKDACPFPKMGRPGANVHGYIQRFAFDHAAELGLRVALLIVQSAQRVPHGARMVVLHEHFGDTQLHEFGAIVGFHEKTASVANNSGTKLIDTGKRGFNSLH